MESSTTNDAADDYNSGLQDQIDALALRIESETAPQAALGLATARTMTVFGLLLLGSGISLAAAPYFSWTLTQAAVWLGTQGVVPGMLAVSGLALLACSTIGNAVARLAERPERTDVGVVDAVEQIADQVAYLSDSFSKLYDQVTVLGLRESTVHVEAPAPSEDLVQIYREQKDAVFQLAAGLDKVGHQVSEQLTSEIGSVTDQLDVLRINLTDAHEQLSTKVGNEVRSNLEAMQELTAKAEATSEQTDEILLEDINEQSPCEVSQFAEADDDLEKELTSTTIVEFARINELMSQNNQNDENETAEEVQLEQPHPDLEAEVSPIAFLDGLKTVAPISQDPNSPSVATPALDFDLLDEVPPALPQVQAESQTETNEESIQNPSTNIES